MRFFRCSKISKNDVLGCDWLVSFRRFRGLKNIRAFVAKTHQTLQM